MAFSDHARDDIVFTPWENMKNVWLLKNGHWKLVGFLKRTACFWLKGVRFIWREKLYMSRIPLLMPLGKYEVDSGSKSSTLFLSWHDQVYGLNACGILMQPEDLEGKSIWCRAEELQC